MNASDVTKRSDDIKLIIRELHSELGRMKLSCTHIFASGVDATVQIGTRKQSIADRNLRGYDPAEVSVYWCCACHRYLP